VSAPRRIDRMIDRLPAALQTDVRESADRLLEIRSPKQAQAALEDEYEHLLRLILPRVIEHPLIRSPAAAATFTAGFAALAATAEEADELLTLASATTLTAPATSVVVAIGLVAAAVETYAAASVRVHQLRNLHYEIDPTQLAIDVRCAVLGVDPSTGRAAMTKRVINGATSRLTKRWVVGAVPVFGIGYAAIDSAKTVRRVLRMPLPKLQLPSAPGLSGTSTACS
jgi:hypothetical protein